MNGEVVSERHFEALMRRERARSDRNHHGFSLLVLSLALSLDDQETLDRLDAVLRTRVRLTDTVGWLPGGKVGVFLPETTPLGAERLALDVRASLDDLQIPSTYSIFTYPDDLGDADAEFSFTGKRDEPTRQAPPGGLDAPLLPGAGEALRGAKGHQRRAFQLEGLLVRPMPLWKRTLDIVLGSTLLLIVSPVVLLAAIAIFLESRGPVIFRQIRAGRGGRPFTFYKLRTMVRGAEQQKEQLRNRNEVDGPVFKIKNDPRHTRVGRILRKTSVDELPQLWNVIKGDMTLVGPRPPTLDEIPGYEPWQRRRLEGAMGITGLWQVSGRSEIGWNDWVRLDLRYLEQQSLLGDLILMAKTVPAVFSGRGAK